MDPSGDELLQFPMEFFKVALQMGQLFSDFHAPITGGIFDVDREMFRDRNPKNA